MLHNIKNTVTPLFLSLSLVSDGWSYWVWESRTTAGSSCALASGLLSQDCVRGCKSSKGGGLGPELSIQRLETENRWGWENQDSVCRDLFYFIFLISNWLCFPPLVVFSVRLDLIWLLLCSPRLLTIFLISFQLSSSFLFLSFPYLLVNNSSLPSLVSSCLMSPS